MGIFQKGRGMKPKPTPPPDLWERLAEAERKSSVFIPGNHKANQFSRLEYQKKNGLGRHGAEDRIRKLIAAGAVKTVVIWSKNINGVWHQIPGYELVEP
jgi:hypothetical protein